MAATSKREGDCDMHDRAQTPKRGQLAACNPTPRTDLTPMLSNLTQSVHFPRRTVPFASRVEV